ncbi:hypothetical protein AVEN_46837-1 [Araneus ventricosus]|uniref:Uncharacterized protein n=1 Tax=Araneus ventricosus TaxID=182803 RepID=A0A4Y2CPN7_ARAVE|nr:hypothetical protein AVEN_46837-1 [Araneus ventricosus]
MILSTHETNLSLYSTTLILKIPNAKGPKGVAKEFVSQEIRHGFRGKVVQRYLTEPIGFFASMFQASFNPLMNGEKGKIIKEHCKNNSKWSSFKTC